MARLMWHASGTCASWRKAFLSICGLLVKGEYICPPQPSDIDTSPERAGWEKTGKNFKVPGLVLAQDESCPLKLPYGHKHGKQPPSYCCLGSL